MAPPKKIVALVTLASVVAIGGGVMALIKTLSAQRDAGKSGKPEVKMVPLADDDYEQDSGHKKSGGAA